MNTFTVFALVAMLVSVAYATPCTEICGAQCNFQKKACDFVHIFGNLCATLEGVCAMACQATCGCADSCAVQCGEENAHCRGADSSAAGPFGGLNVLSCGLNLPVCSSTCQLKCGFNNLAGLVSALGGAGAATAH
ncbi:hypothetical protein EGW08_020407 [Elysia chlorotica]|uniref:Uncharacterized protein n=1 Tax=Elysia chlorotica TaxID=188477 RepID=A0A3S1B0F3_ELYCH|nr:hypothetical protein EGW08_020407 [Elysia chlorotica]